MSSLIVEVCRIGQVSAHPNADALELAQIKGWQAVVPKGRYREGDLITYIPIDAMIPVAHADRWGITRYLSIPKANPEAGRVRCARLRGEPSFGVIVDVEDSSWSEGQDVAEQYGITKYVPPLRPGAGDAEPAHPLFIRYTEVENMRHFPEVIAAGEEVVVTEKVHGTNCRVGAVEGTLLAGSMGVQRKRPEDDHFAASTYWFPFTLPGVRNLVEALAAEHAQVVLFGEVYGSRVQSLAYGRTGGYGFAAFDLFLDGRYQDWDAFQEWCARYAVPVVPVLHRGPFDLPLVVRLSQGSTTIEGADHIREGVVVKPLRERLDPKIGRVCLKYIGDQYLFKSAEGKVTDTEDV